MIKYILILCMLCRVAFGQCNPPTGLVISELSTSTARITYNAAANATLYSWNVYTTYPSHIIANSGTTTATTFIFSGLQPSKTYRFQVITVCGGLGLSSSPDSVVFTTPPAQVIYTPMTQNYQYPYVKIDSGLAIPVLDTAIRRGVNRPGALVWKSAAGFYVYNGSYWQKIGDKYFKFDNNFTVTQVADTFNVFLNTASTGITSRRLLQATAYLHDSTVVIPDSTFITDNGVTIFVQQDSFLIHSEPDGIYRAYAVVVNAANLLDTLKGVADSFGYIYPILRTGDILVTWVRVNGTGFDPVEVQLTLPRKSVVYIKDTTLYGDPNKLGFDGRTFYVGGNADPSAIAEFSASDGGVLMPRMPTDKMNSISSPATGLLIYNTDSLGFMQYNGTMWVNVGGSSAGSSGTLQQAYDADPSSPQISIGSSDNFKIIAASVGNDIGLEIDASSKTVRIGDPSEERVVVTQGGLNVLINAEPDGSGNSTIDMLADTVQVTGAVNTNVGYFVNGVAIGGASSWTVSGSDQYSNVAGNVGIGTTTPDSIFTNFGGIHLSGLYESADGTDSVLVKNANGGVGLRPLSGGSTPGIDAVLAQEQLLTENRIIDGDVSYSLTLTGLQSLNVNSTTGQYWVDNATGNQAGKLDNLGNFELKNPSTNQRYFSVEHITDYRMDFYTNSPLDEARPISQISSDTTDNNAAFGLYTPNTNIRFYDVHSSDATGSEYHFRNMDFSERVEYYDAISGEPAGEFHGRVEIDSLTTTENIYTTSATPGIAAGAGAGGSPTVSIAGTNAGGVVTITTGTLPSTSATVATVTFSSSFAFPNDCSVILFPANANAAALSGAQMIFTSGTTNTWVITSGTVGLTAATTFLFNYKVEGY